MRVFKVEDYEAMSRYGAMVIYNEVVRKVSRGEKVNIGLATGNTMIDLYKYLAEYFNSNHVDLSLLDTFNLDEYVGADMKAVPHDHPLSYWKYMRENLFSRFEPERNFSERQAHFPDPADPGSFDRDLAAAGGLDLQLLGIGFNGHIAFNEPMDPREIPANDFAALPSRVIALKELTLKTNANLTAGGERNAVPRHAATMGMKQILQAKSILLLACFEEQAAPLKAIIAGGKPTPFYPASYLLTHPVSEVVYTGDKINLE